MARDLELLTRERGRIDKQIGAVERTIAALTTPHERTGLMNAKMFEGFDDTAHREEVIERWGSEAYAKSDRWWRGLSEDERRSWQGEVAELNADWVAAAEENVVPASDTAQALAARHIAWLRGVPGAPTGEGFGAYVRGLGEDVRRRRALCGELRRRARGDPRARLPAAQHGRARGIGRGYGRDWAQ